MMNNIQQRVETIFPELVNIRRYFHQHPELSFEEKQTSEKIQEILTKYNIRFTTGWCTHGIVGTIEARNPGSRVIALRADMDALPIQEKNSIEYASIHSGIMHACGHDVHMTGLIGALIVLNEMRDQFEGTIKFIFQPGEEKLPGGASKLIEQGVLENPSPQIILAQHVQPGLAVGKIGLAGGAFMASCDEIYLKVIGKGGHAAQAHLCVDPIYIASQLISALQAVISREKPAGIASVLSFGKIQSLGGATNIIPDEVYLEGTFRALDEEWRIKGLDRIQKICTEITAAFQAHCEINIIKGYPCLINDQEKTRQMMSLSRDYLGEDNVIEMDPRLTSEDFAYYSHKIPAVFYRLGVGEVPGVHTSSFDIDENAIKIASGLLACLAMKI